MHATSLAAVADPSSDLVFLHHPIPNTPGIYDPSSHRLSIAPRSTTLGYYGNLALVDQTLGELCAAISRAGLHESTAVILTSDHWWRDSPWINSAPDYRVPLIIRAPRADGAKTVGRRLCTPPLREMVSSFLAGNISTNADVEECLLREPFAAVPVEYTKEAAEWP
jgi:hypothetical protein